MKILAILTIFIVSIFAKEFTSIKYQGDIDVMGEFDRATLLKVCNIDYPPIYKFWRDDPIFPSSKIKTYIKNIKSYASSVGYFKAEVKAHTDDKTIFITIKKNQPINISTIKIDKNFANLFSMREGDRFRVKDFKSAKDGMSRYMKEVGFAKFILKTKAYVDLKSYKVDIDVDFSLGKLYSFGETTVDNTNANVSKELIKKKLKYKKGDLYDIRKLEDSYESLYKSGVFKDIEVTKKDTNSSDLPLHIKLVEGKSKEFRSSIGYDTEDGLQVGAGIWYNNFLGNFKRFGLEGRVSQRGYKVKNLFYNPELFLKSSFQNDISYEDWDYDTYEQELLTLRSTFGREFFGLKHYFGFLHENSRITSHSLEIKSGRYTINSLFYKLVIDKRDNFLNATKGWYYSLYLERALYDLSSDFDYLKQEHEFRYIKSSSKKLIHALKFRLGKVNKDVPLFKRFYSGGSMSNRGYEYRQVGKLDADGNPIGGNTMLNLSLESRYEVIPSVWVVGFIDSTRISTEIDKFNSKTFSSVGFGARYISVIGPIRVDIGFPMDDGGFSFHLGIGQVF